jgi:hypothetical protein
MRARARAALALSITMRSDMPLFTVASCSINRLACAPKEYGRACFASPYRDD